ncbi:STAS domain-containing protein [Neomoorella humiferrea]|uniref:RsbT co-antagonist protein RsbRA n=1 Tax=Neomoorella humiferrea TaxID=676965 RepID=A0A2T0AXY2_9FIRM|nr:STAS domain-containing protein [Moorella humiferrea]PRR75750.1 RsbT co-antagonist protein RsbRA [Moorella humiferrea]
MEFKAHIKIEELINEVAATGKTKKLWYEFLAAILSPDNKDKKQPEQLKETLSLLLAETGEEALTEKIKVLAENHPDLPITDLLFTIIKICGEIRKEHEQTITNLRRMLPELATPIIRIWTDMLLVALIGNLDSQWAQSIAERLLDRVSATRTKVVLVDVTGVPMIDTAVGGFLIEMFNAIRFLGAEVILTGIKPEVAHTLVKLGVDFRMVTIARDLEDALRKGIAIIADEKKKRRQLARVITGSRESEDDGELEI